MTERKRRPTPPLSAKWLNNQALVYIERYAGSEQRVRQILWKRVRRAQSFHGGNDAEAAPLVEEVIRNLVSLGRIDDTRFALDWATSLQNRGTSQRMIRHKLRQKGLKSPAIDQAMQALDTQTPDWEEEAAHAYASRRRLGPYRIPSDDSWERKQKDLASMARAGFGFAISKIVLKQ